MTTREAPIKIVKVYDRRVWIESDILGDRHVMVQHDAPDAKPFEYCSFRYGYGYTDNASTHGAAEMIARALGATEPIEHRYRDPTPANCARDRYPKGEAPQGLSAEGIEPGPTTVGRAQS